MPREVRKRGKKHKKNPQDTLQNDAYPERNARQEPEPVNEGPSWIIPDPNATSETVDRDAPFGQLDIEVKAYFRTVDTQIKEWQERRESLGEAEDGSNPTEERRLFFMAALNEMRDKEKQLATDPECSVTLERMIYSMDDFGRRVFMDSLCGSYGTLATNRFASHVCQTLFVVARDSLARESNGQLPTIPDTPSQGELRTMKQLVLDICEELVPNVPSLVMDPFASHVIRSLLLLLTPTLAVQEEHASFLRSKKSAVWKAKHGEMKSIFVDEKGKGKDTSSINTPAEFQAMSRRFVDEMRGQLGENEIRAMAANKVACPSLQLLLEVEAERDMSNQPDSLLDRVTVGVVAACWNGKSAHVTESDYLGTLLRDATSSHLLEIVVSRSPEEVFGVLWRLYFVGKLARLAMHPVANFVLAKAFERLPEDDLLEAVPELSETWNKLIKTTRTGVLRAIIERAGSSPSIGEVIPEALRQAFGTKDESQLVLCVLALLPLKDYEHALSSEAPKENATSNRRYPQKTKDVNPLAPTLQGSLLVQSILRIPQPNNQFIIDSILALPIPNRLEIARHPCGSRIFDVFFSSEVVPSKAKRQLIMDFIGSYHILADDKLGSRVVDRCWDFCDTYLKEKIARSLIPEEQTLAASFYGKFFARKLHLPLLQRRAEDWRNLQSQNRGGFQPKVQGKAVPANANVAPGNAAQDEVQPSPKKRKSRPGDEIDALFDSKLGKRIKKAALGDTEATPSIAPSTALKQSKDADLEKVFSAISTAPKTEGYKSKRRK